jgi:ABC-2 type transport system permease protein
MLARPISPLFQILSYEIGLQGIGVLIMGIINIGVGLVSLGWVSPLSILLCMIFTLTGTAIRLSYNLIGACSVFWSDGGQTNATFLIYSVGEYAKYPVTIYPGWMQFVLLFMIPVGFVGFVPALILRGDHALLYTLIVFAATGLYFLLAKTIFYRGILRYESMGM